MSSTQDYPRHVSTKTKKRDIIIACVIVFGALALFFPVLMQRRDRRSCIANLKEQALGTLMYSQDYDNVLPPAKGWMDKLYPYEKDNAPFICPVVAEENRGSVLPVYGYAYHSRLSKVNVSSLREPANTVLTYDSSFEARSISDPFTSLPNPGRHYEYNFVSFVDGHVKGEKMTAIRKLQSRIKQLNMVGSERSGLAHDGDAKSSGQAKNVNE